MKKADQIRAWKDPSYRARVSNDTTAEHPAGIAELDDALLSKIGGATAWRCTGTFQPTLCLACFE